MLAKDYAGGELCMLSIANCEQHSTVLLLQGNRSPCGYGWRHVKQRPASLDSGLL